MYAIRSYYGRLAVIDPELAYLLVRVGQGQAVCAERVGEATGVKIQPYLHFPGPLHPVGEVLRQDLVPIYFLIRFQINSMQIQPLGTGNQ